MALGAVATGNIKAQLALIAAGIIINAGSIPAATPAAAKIGINKVAVAVFEVISVKKVTNRQIDKTSKGTGKSDKPENHSHIKALKPELENALAIQIPPANSNNMPQGIDTAVSQSSNLLDLDFVVTSPN